MPNWCNNYLEVVGDAETIKKFIEVGITDEPNAYQKDKTSPTWRLSNYHPMPEILQRTISPTPNKKDNRMYVNEWEVESAKKQGIKVPVLIPCENNTKRKCNKLIKLYGATNWYDWKINNYGTKWDCSSIDFTIEETKFSTLFDSAWSPPTTWLEKVQKDYPTLKFKLIYEEIGNWFAGIAYTAEFEEGEEPYINIEDGEPQHCIEDIGNVSYCGWESNAYVSADGTTIYKYNEDEDCYISTTDDEDRFDEDDITTENPYDNYVTWWE
jgi:hypothetical protein